MAIVGDLVVHLAASTAGLTAGLNVARKDLKGFASFVSSAIGAAGILDSVAAFHRAEQAGKKLDAALAATGGNAGVTAAEIKKLAADLQKVTNFEDDATVAAAALLGKFTNIRGDVFKQAIVSAADFSALTGRDLPASINLIGRALNDPVKGMILLRKVGAGLSADQQALVKQLVDGGNLAGAQGLILDSLKGKFSGAAQGMADPLTIMKNLIGDIAENIGSFFLPSLQEIASFFADVINPSAAETTKLFSDWGQVLKGWVHDALLFVEDSITVIAFGIENIGPLSELAFKKAELFAVQFAAEVTHFFTGTMPTLFDWLLNNWQDVFFTIGDFASTVFINIGENIRSIMSAAWEFIKSGGTSSLEVAWEPLTKGFVNTIKALPELPKREAGEIEKGLVGEIDALSSDLSERLGDAMNNAARTASERTKPLIPDFLSGGVAGEAKTAAAKKTGAGALEFGSKEAFSAIFQNQRGDDTQERILKVEEEQLKEQQRQNDLLEVIAEEADTEVIDL